MRKILLILISIIIINKSYSQNFPGYYQGYTELGFVVTNNNDTIYGTIKVKSFKKQQEKVIFIDKRKKETIYFPEDLKSYSFLKFKFYSDTINNTKRFIYKKDFGDYIVTKNNDTIYGEIVDKPGLYKYSKVTFIDSYKKKKEYSANDLNGYLYIHLKDSSAYNSYYHNQLGENRFFLKLLDGQFKFYYLRYRAKDSDGYNALVQEGYIKIDDNPIEFAFNCNWDYPKIDVQYEIGDLIEGYAVTINNDTIYGNILFEGEIIMQERLTFKDSLGNKLIGIGV